MNNELEIPEVEIERIKNDATYHTWAVYNNAILWQNDASAQNRMAGYIEGAKAEYLKKLSPCMRWIKARDQKPEPYTDVMIRNENDHLLFTLGRNAEHLEEWSTEDSNTWFFDDTEWLYEPSPAQ
jgi:hypothetical protein